MALSVLPDLKSKGDDFKFLGVVKNDGDGPSGESGSSKTYPRYPSNSVYGAAIQNHGFSFLWDSEFSRVDWERGTFHSCSLSQDRRALFLYSRNSPRPGVREFGTKADSR